MIEMNKAEEYRSCNVCTSRHNVQNITFWANGTNSGTQIALCQECLTELSEMIHFFLRIAEHK